jgi:hypothetical protein
MTTQTQEAQDNLPKEAVITQLFKDVERFVNEEEYTKVLRSIDKSNYNLIK